MLHPYSCPSTMRWRPRKLERGLLGSVWGFALRYGPTSPFFSVVVQEINILPVKPTCLRCLIWSCCICRSNASCRPLGVHCVAIVMADSPQAILRDEPRGYIVPRLLELLHSWMRRYFTPSIMSSQYAHQNYVHIDTPSTKAEHRAAVEAATYATSILARSLNPQVRWAFRGCIAYKCHVQSDVYTRYTDVSSQRLPGHSFLAAELFRTWTSSSTPRNMDI